MKDNDLSILKIAPRNSGKKRWFVFLALTEKVVLLLDKTPFIKALLDIQVFTVMVY